jgi:hypothetical protein
MLGITTSKEITLLAPNIVRYLPVWTVSQWKLRAAYYQSYDAW